MPESNKKDLFYATAKTVFLCACFFLLFAALFTYIPKAVDTISNTISEKKLPIYCVKTDKPQIALSFDAAWGNEDTARILEILAKHDVHVTFFMTGGWMNKYPDDVKAILAPRRLCCEKAWQFFRLHIPHGQERNSYVYVRRKCFECDGQEGL